MTGGGLPILAWWRDRAHARDLERRFPGARVFRGARAERSTLGRNTTLYPGAILVDGSLGDYSYVAHGSELRATTIGRFCSIGPGVKCGLGAHPTERFVSTHPAFYSTARQCGVTFADRDCFEEVAPVRIGNDVWIGANAVIANGVVIGDGAVIAAGAVVAADVEPYGIAGGVPAKTIRSRFPKEQVEALLALRWWEKPDDWLRAHWHDMHDVATLLRVAR